MGNSASSAGRAPHDDTVDFGSLVPQGVYTGPRDWNNSIVTQLIIDRKLAPFYRPLEEYEDSWDDDQILAARKEFPDGDGATPDTGVRAETAPPPRPNSSHPSKRSSTLKEPSRNPEAMIYRSAVECPICFLVRRRVITTSQSHLFMTSRSITLPTSIAHGAAIKLSARNALFRLNVLNLPLNILYQSQQLAPTVSKTTLALYIPLQHGELALAQIIMFVNFFTFLLNNRHF